MFEKLPLDLQKEIFLFYADGQTKGQLLQVSKSFNTFFKPLSLRAKLLSLVVKADYVGAQKIVEMKPKVMFQEVLYQNQIISPLKLAFKLLDTYMWQLFEKHIAHSPKLKLLFERQLVEQNEYIDLQPLLDKYESYKDEHVKWLGARVSDEDLDKVWLDLGKRQRDLPRHMLKEYFRAKRWDQETNFSVKTNGPPQISLDSALFAPDGGLGFKFTLLRREANAAPEPSYIDGNKESRAQWWWSYVDAATLGRLLMERRHDLDSRRLALKVAQKSTDQVEASFASFSFT